MALKLLKLLDTHTTSPLQQSKKQLDGTLNYEPNVRIERFSLGGIAPTGWVMNNLAAQNLEKGKPC